VRIQYTSVHWCLVVLLLALYFKLIIWG